MSEEVEMVQETNSKEESEVVQESNGKEDNDVVPETNGKEVKEKEAIDEAGVEETKAEESKADESKTSEKLEDPIDLEAEIIRQVEYYFGDVNLPRDRFLRGQILLDNGWVPISVLLKFNRLSKLSTEVAEIEKALKKAESGVIEVADGRVRRNPDKPVPEMNESRRKELMDRTIYAKGFPKNSSLDDVLKYFKKFDKVENVIMRRYLDNRTKARLFKGSVFATFNTKEQAEKFIEEKDSIEYQNTKLLVMWQNDYTDLKHKERDDRYKKKEQKTQNKINSQKAALTLPTGSVIYFDDGNEKLTREEIKTALTKLDKKIDIAFIDYKIGLTKGWIRLATENGAIDFMKLLNDNKLKVGEHEITIKVLEGEEEKEYLTKTVEEMHKRRNSNKVGKKGKGNSNKGKYFKRSRGNDNENGPPSKVKRQS